jgi:hypothetical protein
MPVQQPSEHGRILGTQLAWVADVMAAQRVDVPDRCKTCAFRAGTIPSRMAGTLAQALNCVAGLDPSPFMCHHSLRGGEPTQLCAGYVLAKSAPIELLHRALTRATLQLVELPKKNEVTAP